MIAKSILLLFVLYVTDISSRKLDYTYDALAGGWLKYHKAASTWRDASIRCHTEQAVLASPLNSQLRDAIKDYVSRMKPSDSTILTGVKADSSSRDYYSVEGVPLKNMPVFIKKDATIEYESSESSESCVKWISGNATVKIVQCNDKLPYVCYKQRTSWQIAGCNTTDPEYKYDERSGSCYKFHKRGSSWSEAQVRCEEEGAYLAINNNQLENEVLKELYAMYPYKTFTSSIFDQVFMGIRDWLEGDSWETVKGESLEKAGFTGWGTGQPNNIHGSQHCVTLRRNGTYNDINCDYSLVFICEKYPEILYKITS